MVNQISDTFMTTLLKKVSIKLQDNNLSLASAESCTGGWLAKQVTDLAGSSSVFDRGFVTYSNQAKQDMLGVKLATLKAHGAVSEAVAKEMAEGALKYSQADITVSITGVAGPGGGTKDKPVGMVCFGWIKSGGETIVKTVLFSGDRDSVREQAVNFALNGIYDLI